MPDTQRLFLAIWPPSDLSQQLHRLARNFLRGGERAVAAENIHLTLAFLGSVNAAFRECVEQAASAIRVEPFTLTLEQMGCWPKSGILWTGPRSTPAPLSQLSRALNAGLAACGYAPEQRPFMPHMTLARKVHCHTSSPGIEPWAWEAREFCLARSSTRSDGARYEILRSWPFIPP